MPVVRRSAGRSAIVTRELLPLKANAASYLPVSVLAAVPIVPVLPFPDASATLAPVPSLKE
jgi:hypothetical protein